MRCIMCGTEMKNTTCDLGRWGTFECKNIYAFYSPFTNHDNKDDVAVVAARNKPEAIEKLQKYYKNANEDNVKEVNFNNLDNVCILCDTY